MTVPEIRAWTRAEPFQPFRVTLKNGMTFIIKYPDMLVVGGSMAYIAYTPHGDGAERTMLDQIEKLELVPAA